ncbi:HD domain-containing protein [Pendulispora brunnea]|uniref:HD domain-containing protein n=1 Tax=Pendulispora brunnea TaxID=2905690 RepID=A0ABZ2KCI8_9BACT
MHDELLDLLLGLDGVRQPLRYHPEEDALYHSLQVFDLARRESDDAVLWAAALFHDVGKAIDGRTHDEVGADLLEGLLAPRAVWLVRHHLDLLREPRRTRRKYRGTRELADLERLRRWDLGGRRIGIRVLSAEEAVDLLVHSAIDDDERNVFTR